jgi:Ni/Fe-hydrogenase subunit HybB-like protein
MLEQKRGGNYPAWQRPLPTDTRSQEQIEHARREKLALDVLPPGQMQDLALRPMTGISLPFLVVWGLVTVGVLLLAVTWLYQMIEGIGITGLNRPVMWAVYIVNFVYFIGIGHAGTFISAAFRALRIKWRAPISRPAELLTVFGLATAGLFPLIHLGRAWKAYWLLPYPNQRLIWPSFHSMLVIDLIAITTYLTCSALFAWLALIPDLAMARDRLIAPRWRHRLYEILSFGWRGTDRQWSFHETAMNVFAYAIIPVMFSVHTVVSWDFAVALQPGWHSTIFGPYFVIGALFSGVAAVIIIMAIIRRFMHLEYFLRPEHFNGMGVFLLLLSFAWAYFFFNEYYVIWYGQHPVEMVIFGDWARGGPAPIFYLMLFSNIVLPWATLWSKRLRSSIPVLVIVSLFVNIGMYAERVLIVPVALGYNEFPFSWGVYRLQIPETLITIGAFSLVVWLFFAFSKLFPIIPVWEVEEQQVLQGMQQVGRAMVETRVEPE